LSDPEKKRFQFEDGNGTYTVEVWCEGREYQPEEEAYRPRYAYLIQHPDWQYTDNDIHGAVNELPSLESAAKSLFAFLYACQEGLPRDYKHESENATLFPPHVRDWAYQCSEEITAVYHQLEEGVA
jgi:hypothetical protein